jgi:hypothetical protein
MIINRVILCQFRNLDSDSFGSSRLLNLKDLDYSPALHVFVKSICEPSVSRSYQPNFSASSTIPSLAKKSPVSGFPASVDGSNSIFRITNMFATTATWSLGIRWAPQIADRPLGSGRMWNSQVSSPSEIVNASPVSSTLSVE